MKRPQAALFDALAAGAQLYVYPQESLNKLNAVTLNKGRTLDVGCGDGAIPTAFDAPRVFGFDVSPRCARLSTEARSSFDCCGRHTGIAFCVVEL